MAIFQHQIIILANFKFIPFYRKQWRIVFKMKSINILAAVPFQ